MDFLATSVSEPRIHRNCLLLHDLFHTYGLVYASFSSSHQSCPFDFIDECLASCTRRRYLKTARNKGEEKSRSSLAKDELCGRREPSSAPPLRSTLSTMSAPESRTFHCDLPLASESANAQGHDLPGNAFTLRQTAQLEGLLTQIRDRDTSR